MTNNTPLTSERRRRLIESHGMGCRCGFTAEHVCQLQVDHILPTWLGGNDEDENLQVICARCHAYKSAVDDPALAKQLRHQP